MKQEITARPHNDLLVVAWISHRILLGIENRPLGPFFRPLRSAGFSTDNLSSTAAPQIRKCLLPSFFFFWTAEKNQEESVDGSQPARLQRLEESVFKVLQLRPTDTKPRAMADPSAINALQPDYEKKQKKQQQIMRGKKILRTITMGDNKNKNHFII